MGFIHGAHRHEASLCPERLDDSLAEENPVRFIDAFVDHLNLSTRGFQRATPAATGRPAYAPADLLPLSIYGSLSRLRASRRLAQAPHRQVELRWLLQTLRPAHQTRAAFRQHTLKPLRQVCRECTVWCQPRDLLAGPLVASDGSTGKAVNAKERNCTSDKRKDLLQQIDQRGEASLPDLDGAENAEEAGPPGGAVVDNVQAKMEGLQQRKLL